MTSIKYPNRFPSSPPRVFTKELLEQYDFVQSAEQANPSKVCMAGRITRITPMGKSIFANLQDMYGTIQLFIGQGNNGLELEQPEACSKHLNRGDIVWLQGSLMMTKTQVKTVRVHEIRLLNKAKRPLPEKFHGLKDIEQRYRKRYLDLISNEAARNVFITRFEMIKHIRQFFDQRQYYEVETPMLHPIAGGAKAKPFATHHNALDMDMYLRIAPELYLKRLVVGGFERVYEINRSFRNEGISTQHNPEFTMLEMYQAYGDYETMMDIVETLVHELAEKFSAPNEEGNQNDQDATPDLSIAFRRMTMQEAVCQHTGLSAEQVNDTVALQQYIQKNNVAHRPSNDQSKLMVAIFEHVVEAKLIQPTFITEFPKSVSPLARSFDERPEYAERFEMFIGGKEVANGFSELNDSEEQQRRFEEQMKEKASGDEEAMEYDDDYITALEHGMPPTCGAGIGIDRLVMMLTQAESIRDVILFPHMRHTSK